jgi:hypothetical protein
VLARLGATLHRPRAAKRWRRQLVGGACFSSQLSLPFLAYRYACVRRAGCPLSEGLVPDVSGAGGGGWACPPVSLLPRPGLQGPPGRVWLGIARAGLVHAKCGAGRMARQFAAWVCLGACRPTERLRSSGWDLRLSASCRLAAEPTSGCEARLAASLWRPTCPQVSQSRRPGSAARKPRAEERWSWGE